MSRQFTNWLRENENNLYNKITPEQFDISIIHCFQEPAKMQFRPGFQGGRDRGSDFYSSPRYNDRNGRRYGPSNRNNCNHGGWGNSKLSLNSTWSRSNRRSQTGASKGVDKRKKSIERTINKISMMIYCYYSKM